MTNLPSSYRSLQWSRRSPLLLQDIPHGVVQAANGVLHFAFDFVGIPFGLQFPVAGRLADRLLHGAFGFFRGADDPVLIHDDFLLRFSLLRAKLSDYRA